MKAQILFFIRPSYLNATYDLYLRQMATLGSEVQVNFATEVLLEKVTPENEGMERAPLLTLDRGAVQSLMDELYRAGLRPSDAPNQAGIVEAMVDHIDDLRMIVEKTLEVKLR